MDMYSRVFMFNIGIYFRLIHESFLHVEWIFVFNVYIVYGFNFISGEFIIVIILNICFNF